MVWGTGGERNYVHRKFSYAEEKDDLYDTKCAEITENPDHEWWEGADALEWESGSSGYKVPETMKAGSKIFVHHVYGVKQGTK